MHHHYSLMINKCGILNASKGFKTKLYCRTFSCIKIAVVCLKYMSGFNFLITLVFSFSLFLKNGWMIMRVSLSILKRGEFSRSCVEMWEICKRQTFLGWNVIFSNFFKIPQDKEKESSFTYMFKVWRKDYKEVLCIYVWEACEKSKLNI